MKILFTLGTIACMLIVTKANSQQAILPLNQHPSEKVSLFNHLPEKISCTANTLQNIFTSPVNEEISFSLSSELEIEGTVMAKVVVSPEQLSMNIRCANYQNALLNISRITKADGSIYYTGRIVSLQHGDILMLSEEDGQYSFSRQKQSFTMME